VWEKKLPVIFRLMIHNAFPQEEGLKLWITGLSQARPKTPTT